MSIDVKQFAAAFLVFLTSFGSNAQSGAEKVYLQFDKPYYTEGEICWFKAYVVDESFNPTPTSGILYVDFIDGSGKVIKHQRLKIYSGEAAGDFRFDSAGAYTVRSYTSYMRNEAPEFFFYRSISVYGDTLTRVRDTSHKIDLQFFPESGTAVEHLTTQVAFKAIDQNGSGIDVSGEIVDENNLTVAKLKTIYYGMGIFPYLPAPGKKYRVILSTGEKFELPDAVPSGVVINANNIHPEKLYLRIQSSLVGPIKLSGFSKGKLLFNKSFETIRGHADIEIPKSDLPPGIFQLTAYNSAGTPLAERIIFIKQLQKLNLIISTENKIIKSRDSVTVLIKTTDNSGKPVPASLSLSIADAAYITKDSAAPNMLTHLLLQSDLKGNIEHPARYFQPGNDYALDLVMLTNGWRKYEPLKNVLYKAEQYLFLKGRVFSPVNNAPLPRATISLMIADIEYNGVYTAISDDSGNFRIDSIDFSDSSNLVWQIMNEKGKLTDAKIELNSDADIPVVNQNMAGKNIRLASLEKPISLNRVRYSDTTKIGMLDTVEVVRKKRTYRTVGVGAQLVRPDKDDMKTMATTFLSKYAMGLPFLTPVTNELGETTWLTSGGGPVKMIINGYVVDDKTPGGNPFLVLNSYRTDELDYAIVSGNNRSGYTIMLQTKIPPNTPTPGIFKQKAKGYEYARIYYHPRYGPDNNRAIADYRTTLYWEPYILTDSNGEAVISFYNSDVAKKFLIVAEGLANGLILSDMKTIGGD